MDTLEFIGQRLANIEAMLINTKTVLTFGEAASYTGLSKSYLYKLSSNGGVPCYKPGGKVLYFNRAELDAWMMQNRKATNAELETDANTYLVVKGGAK
jgi:excisionase family DNA binding protein